MSQADAIAVSYQACQRVVDRSGSSFARSFLFLRPSTRRSIHALYAFARLVDDLCDSPQANQSPQVVARILASLHSWIELLARRGRHGSTATAPVLPMIAPPGPLQPPQSAWLTEELAAATAAASGWVALLIDELHRIGPALSETIAWHQLDPQLLHELVHGAESDACGPVRVADDGALKKYCYQVASTVGLACIQIWGGDGENLRPMGVAGGVAFQLTNILRDVHEDAMRDRIYLPLSDLSAYGCSEAAWLAGKPDGDWRGLILKYVAIARDNYDQSRGLFKALPEEGQRMFALMWLSYNQLLREIERSPEALWKRRVRLSFARKLGLYLQTAFTPWHRWQLSRLASDPPTPY